MSNTAGLHTSKTQATERPQCHAQATGSEASRQNSASLPMLQFTHLGTPRGHTETRRILLELASQPMGTPMHSQV